MNIRTVKAGDLNSVANEMPHGIVTIVGDAGGLSRITGEVYPSNVMSGCLGVETEHGVIYLEEEEDVPILVPAPPVTDRDMVNDVLSGPAGFGLDLTDEDLNDLTHRVADLIDAAIATQEQP